MLSQSCAFSQTWYDLVKRSILARVCNSVSNATPRASVVTAWRYRARATVLAPPGARLLLVGAMDGSIGGYEYSGMTQDCLAFCDVVELFCNLRPVVSIVLSQV